MTEKQKLLSRKIKVLRAQAGLSQSQLAEKSGISKSTMNFIEHGRAGRNETRYVTIVKVANALGVEPEELTQYLD